MTPPKSTLSSAHKLKVVKMSYYPVLSIWVSYLLLILGIISGWELGGPRYSLPTTVQIPVALKYLPPIDYNHSTTPGKHSNYSK